MFKRLLYVAALASLLCASLPVGAGEADPFEIVASLTNPEPITLVGTDEGGKIGVGLVFHPDGPAAAYVCDGEKLSVWFNGSLGKDEEKALLKDGGGNTISADWSKPGAIRGEARIGERRIKFALELASSGRLLRHQGTVDGRQQVSGMIVTNRGDVYGASGPPGDATARRVKRTARSKKAETTSDAAALPTGPEAGNKTPDDQAAAFRRLRCKSIVNKMARRLRDLRGEVIQEFTDDPQFLQLLEKGLRLGCDEFVFELFREKFREENRSGIKE